VNAQDPLPALPEAAEQTTPEDDAHDQRSRRDLLKALAVGGGAIAASSLLNAQPALSQTIERTRPRTFDAPGTARDVKQDHGWDPDMQRTPDARTVYWHGAVAPRNAHSGDLWYQTNAVPKDKLVLYMDASDPDSYPGSGEKWFNLFGPGGDGNVSAGVSHVVGPQAHFNFNGTSGDITVPSFASDPEPGLSVMVWLYPTNLATQLNDGNWLNWIANDRNTTSPNSNSWQFLTRNSVPILSVWNNNNALITAPSGDQVAASEKALTLNAWQHVGFTTSGTSGSVLRVYLDGQVNSETELLGDRGFAIKPLILGRAGWFSGFLWHGRMAIVQVHNRELTGAEVAGNFRSERKRFGL
jgi:hypothetical protein